MDKIQEREIELLRIIPKSEVLDFVEKNGQKIRSLLEEDILMTNEEILEALQNWYSEYT